MDILDTYICGSLLHRKDILILFSGFSLHYFFCPHSIFLFLPHSTHVHSPEMLWPQVRQEGDDIVHTHRAISKRLHPPPCVSEPGQGQASNTFSWKPHRTKAYSWYGVCAWAKSPHQTEIMESFLPTSHKKKSLLAENESTQRGVLLLMKSNIQSHSKVPESLLMETLLPSEYCKTWPQRQLSVWMTKGIKSKWDGAKNSQWTYTSLIQIPVFENVNLAFYQTNKLWEVPLVLGWEGIALPSIGTIRLTVPFGTVASSRSDGSLTLRPHPVCCDKTQLQCPPPWHLRSFLVLLQCRDASHMLWREEGGGESRAFCVYE